MLPADPSPADVALAALLTEAMALNDGDAAVAFRVVVADGVARAVGPVAVGAPPIVGACLILDGMPVTDWKLSVGRMPSTNRWVHQGIGDVAPVTARVWEATGVGCQLSALVILRGRLWGFVGVARLATRPPYTERDALGARPAGRVLAARVAETDALDLGVQRRDGRLLLAAGEVRYADAGARAWAADPERVADLARRLGPPVAGAEVVRWARGDVAVAHAVDGPDGAAWMVTLHPPEHMPATPLAHLSPIRRSIAELAAAGATNAEIARSLGRSEHTIKTHLKQVYAETGVASRAELLAMLRETFPEAVTTRRG